MKHFLWFFLFSFPAFAEIFSGEVFSFNQQEGFIRFTNGRVAFVRDSKSLIEEIQPRAILRVKIDNQNFLDSFERIENLPPKETPSPDHHLFAPPEYRPTILPNLKAADEVFNRLRPDFKRRSECSDRAHVWAYDEFKKNGLNSQKIFALFTASYINRNHFKWWFHVAPLVLVKNGEKIEQRVLDFRYTDRPTLLKDWTDMMVFSKRSCKETTKFSEYDVNPQTEDCYMIIESMYYRLPGDLSEQELSQKYRDQFYEYEVNFSRNTAFDKKI
jgi:hypothetical protein